MANPKYLDIASKIESLIDSGKYPQGSKLPTHRALANELDTTPATVAKAYNALVEKKRIESFVGRGSYVCSDTKLDQVIRSPEGNEELNFSILQPCFSQQLTQLNTLLQQHFSSLSDPRLYGYAENSGLWQHREAGLSWAWHYGLEDCSVEQILLVNGAQHALSALIQLYTKPGDLIAVEAQTYPGILSIASFLGRRVIGLEMDEQGVIPEALEQACQQQAAMVILVPSHQNPTGATMAEARRDAIAAAIERHQIWLVEDDIYGFLNDRVIGSIANRLPERSFHISSLSKAISPGMRCAYIRAPQSEASQLAAFIRATIWLSSPFMFDAASQLIDSGEAFRFAELQRETARQRQAIAREVLGHHKVSSQPTSYHQWLELPPHWQPDQFALAAKAQGMLVSSATYFNTMPQPVNAIRLSLMAIADLETYRQGLGKLASLIDEPQQAHMHF